MKIDMVILWIGTLGGGLNRLHTMEVPQYFLYRADINDILEDFEGVLGSQRLKVFTGRIRHQISYKHFVYPGTQLTSDMVISGY
jgi:hypothetical protein